MGTLHLGEASHMCWAWGFHRQVGWETNCGIPLLPAPACMQWNSTGIKWYFDAFAKALQFSKSGTYNKIWWIYRTQPPFLLYLEQNFFALKLAVITMYARLFVQHKASTGPYLYFHWSCSLHDHLNLMSVLWFSKHQQTLVGISPVAEVRHL